MNKAIIFLFLSLMAVTNTGFQATTRLTPRAQVFRGYCVDNPEDWKAGIKVLQEAVQKEPHNGDVLFDLVLSQYGYIGARLSESSPAELDPEIEKTLSLIERLRNLEGYQSHGEAFFGALLAIKIGLKPLRAITLGSKSEKAIKRSVALDPQNPVAWVEMGNMRFHAPGIFGGSNPEAIECFRKAVYLFEANPNLREHNWQYLHALATLGQAYEKAYRYKEAIGVYEKALAYSPDFRWVKEDLLPKVRRKG